MASEILGRRLAAQRLAGERFGSAVEAVGRLGAVQAQDYQGVKWALALRSGAHEAELDAAYDAGAILRLHVLRPTWHLVLPEDVRWLLELTGPRVRRWTESRRRQLDLGEADVARGHAVLTEVLAERGPQSRDELAAALAAAAFDPSPERMLHLLLAAEVDCLVVSGPRRGRQFTYALLDERAPKARRLTREDALAELAGRYYSTRGPARDVDFAWWSGLTLADARRAIAAAGLRRESAGGVEYWSGGEGRRPAGAEVLHLLPNFDEFTVAYRDRSLLHPEPFDPSLFAFGSILSNVITVGGRVVGSWRTRREGGRLRAKTRLARPPGRIEPRLRAELQRYAKFRGLELAVED